ncbi:hypothetical protein PYCC9005_003884 [Savitreella phatthalungensis]
MPREPSGKDKSRRPALQGGGGNGKRNPKTSSRASQSSGPSLLASALADEDSGDRWVSADPAKAVRFYEKAMAGYSDALHAGGTDDDTMDALFNRARLSLVVGTLPSAFLYDALHALATALTHHTHLLTLHNQSNTLDLADLRFNRAAAAAALLELSQHHHIDFSITTDTVREALGDAGWRMGEMGWGDLAEVVGIQESDLARGDSGEGEELVGGDGVVAVVRATESQLLDTLTAQVELAAQLLLLDNTAAAHDTLAQIDQVVQAAQPRAALAIERITDDMHSAGVQDDGDTAAADEFQDAVDAYELAKLERLATLPTPTLPSLKTWYDSLVGSSRQLQAQSPRASTTRLAALADAFISLARTALDLAAGEPELADAASVLAWEGLSQHAAKLLASASEGDPSSAGVWLSRGDLDLLRATVPRDVAQNARRTLLANAQKFYTRAAAEARLISSK